MAKLDLLIDAWDEGQREFNFVFEGLEDEDLWRRADPRLLSIGELAGHLVYWKVQKATAHLTPESPDWIDSILSDERFRYYTTEVNQPVVFDLSVSEVETEMNRIHQLARDLVVKLDPAFTDPIPGEPRATWGFYVQYMAFHMAYHTGQAYSVRHLLGHTPTDN